MKKNRFKIIVAIVIIIATISIISNMRTVPYQDVRKDIERRFNNDGNSISGLVVEKNYSKKHYILVVYVKNLFDKYIDDIFDLDYHYVGRYLLENNREDKREVIYIVCGYNPNRIISNFKFKIDNELMIEDVSKEDYFIKVYKGDFEIGMDDWGRFYDKNGEELTTELIIRD